VRLPASVFGSASNAALGDSSSSTRLCRTVTVPASRVDVFPPQRDDLAAPKPAPRGQQYSGPVPRSDCIDERDHLGDGCDRACFGTVRTRARDVHGLVLIAPSRSYQCGSSTHSRRAAPKMVPSRYLTQRLVSSGSCGTSP